MLVMPFGHALAAQGEALLSPAQAAFLRDQNQRIEDYFVAQVAQIVQLSPAQVRRALPDQRRITASVARLIAVLEHDLGMRLTPDQHAAILAADQQRLAALARVREGAAQR